MYMYESRRTNLSKNVIMYIVHFLRVTITYTHLIVGWVEPDASISMFVCLVVRVLLEQEVGTVAVDGGSLLG